MKINFETASFRDFENIPGMDVWQRAAEFERYLHYQSQKGHLNYRLKVTSPSGPELVLDIPGKPSQSYVSLVSNDYLGFSQHPKVIAAAVEGLHRYGFGSGASPAIGGHYAYHEALEKKIAAFFGHETAITYTTGYTANSATLQCLLRKEDIAIIDMAVHASVHEGCLLTNVKRFPHNNMEALERILGATKREYRTRLVVVDGVYSQDGDFARLGEIVKLARTYGAKVMVDDAHGIGVVGNSGRGVIEQSDLFHEIDIITGTFSKTFAHVGGYVVAAPEIISFLKYQSKQHLFSVTASPASAGVLKSIDLIDEEPEWMVKLRANARYLNEGLRGLGFDTGNTTSAIIPVKIGDPVLCREAGRLLLDAGIYMNPITYPAVALKDARIRTSVMATHTREQLDRVLNAFEYAGRKLPIHKNLIM